MALAGGAIVGQHPSVAVGWLGRWGRLRRSFVVAWPLVLGSAAACDRTVTSIGSWQPLVEQAGAGVGGVAAAAGVDASGGSSGNGGTAVEVEGGNGGAPDSPGMYLEAEDG